MPLARKPLLERMLQRVMASSVPFSLVVATTTDTSDDPVDELCKRLGYRTYRGHATDLLDRHYHAALPEEPDAVVKIPSDCPLIDPRVIDSVLSRFCADADRFDYVSNLHPATYPDGNDVEIMKFSALETAWREARKDFEREHTTPFLWEHPERFRIGNVEWETGLDYSMSHRWTIDYPEDYRFIAAVYDALLPIAGPLFGMDDILGLLQRSPEIGTINERYAGVNWYRHHLDELRTIKPGEARHLPHEQ
jgi:spore coat polysaccharide biosynthesis protein SpsF